MKKTVCDICGKEIVDTPWELTLEEQYPFSFTVELESIHCELCDRCAKQISSFLKVMKGETV